MTNLEKAQEYLNNLKAEMDMAVDEAESIPYEVLSSSHPCYEAASKASTKYYTALYMMQLMKDVMLEQHVNDMRKDEKKYRYNVGLMAERCTSGTIVLTKEQAQAVYYASDTRNWDNLNEESYSGDFSIDIDNPEEV